MKTKLNHAICVLLTLLFFALIVVTASGGLFANASTVTAINSIAAYDSFEKNARLYDVVINHIQQEMSEDGARQISAVKELSDFNGDRYTLFELAPTGYIIYHNDSGHFIEYAQSSPSPYLGVKADIYYGGMLSFYKKTDEGFAHTLFNEEVLNEEDIYALEQESAIISYRNNQTKQINNLAYIDGKISIKELNTLNSKAAAELKSSYITENETAPLAATTTPRIGMAAFFKPLDNETKYGSPKQGTCGYVAANMVLAYNRFAYDDALVDAKYLNIPDKCLNGTDLTFELLALDGYGTTPPNGKSEYPSTTGYEIMNVIKKYLDKHYTPNTISWVVTWLVGSLLAPQAIAKNQPVILFGNLKDVQASGNINHAVVAYGMSGTFITTYTVHYGVKNYSEVNLGASVIGTDVILSCF